LKIICLNLKQGKDRSTAINNAYCGSALATRRPTRRRPSRAKIHICPQ
jgi:hypothetical protein